MLVYILNFANTASATALDQLDDKSTALLIALLILALIAAVVNGAYAVYVRKRMCTGPDIKKQAMQVWNDKKKELEGMLLEDVKEDADEEKAKMIDEIEKRIDRELHLLKEQIKREN